MMAENSASAGQVWARFDSCVRVHGFWRSFWLVAKASA